MKHKFIIFSAVVIGVGGMFAWWLLKPETATSPANTTEQVTTLNDSHSGLSLTYNARLFEGELTPDDLANGVFFRLLQPQGEAPLQITVRIDDGKAEASQATGEETRKLALESAKLAKPNEYESYDFSSERLFEINGKPAAELIFTYGRETRVTQRLVIIERDPDTIILLTAQSTTSDYESNNDKYVEEIIKSVKFR